MAGREGAVAGLGIDPEFWRDRRVLLTGHTGFKGAWAALWLQAMGAELTGFSIDVPTTPSLYELADVESGMRSVTGDVRDHAALDAVVQEARPEVVIHMAAQSLVRRSFATPRETYETNVLGTVNVFEAARQSDEVRVLINVTSDKCYANREWEWGYREDEPMGGFDPYSSSKGCAELVTRAYRSSFLADPAGPRLASARAGNVIGGGDWGEDRLIPDIMRGALSDEPIEIRNPSAVRPWQHVLNPLSGYLRLAEAMWDDPDQATAVNFGPSDEDAQPVQWIVDRVIERWPGQLDWRVDRGAHPHEAGSLRLDSSRARARLHWRPQWGLARGLDATVEWYLGYRDGEDVREVTLRQIRMFAEGTAT